MKRPMRYMVNDQLVEKEVNYIPVRYILAIVLTVLEVAAVIGILVVLCYYVPYFYLAAWLTEIGCVVKIIASDDNPDYKVPWLLFVLIIPIAGFMLYFMFYSRTLQKKFIRRLDELKSLSYQKDDSPQMAALREESSMAYTQATMLCKISDSHLFTNTRQTYFPLGEDMFASMLEELQKAEHFIYMEYFIIEEGKFWNSILDILKEKAAAGVDVRVLYDDIGCMATLPGDYCKTLGTYGIQATPFSHLRGHADSEFNNRSHRKILVIDGKVGYTGGVNIADEYINEVERFGHWKDTAIRLEGEAVWELTKLFLVDFGINVRRLPEPASQLYPAQPLTQANGYLIPFGDGPSPIYDRRIGKTVIQSMLSAATRYAWMTSPYLIIDNDLCTDLENAALRGVDVRIIVPHVPDKKLVFAMTQSFYPRLMAAGVKIYEYEPGFIHAKSYLVDDDYAMIGTINLDYRSLVHHFENGVWLYRCDANRSLKADLEDTFTKCIPVTPDMLKTNLLQRSLRAIVRIFAPML
ncbi:MAG: cardiolipin synthase [Lachnospiraceae bacterium]|nr:cardiolipin synthase [Lachnospiraceae bacterium]